MRQPYFVKKCLSYLRNCCQREADSKESDKRYGDTLSINQQALLIKTLSYLRDHKMRGNRASSACKGSNGKRGALLAGLRTVKIELTAVVVTLYAAF